MIGGYSGYRLFWRLAPFEERRRIVWLREILWVSNSELL
jgi:hypothetical protein